MAYLWYLLIFFTPRSSSHLKKKEERKKEGKETLPTNTWDLGQM
jgi:hypothetical protein